MRRLLPAVVSVVRERPREILFVKGRHAIRVECSVVHQCAVTLARVRDRRETQVQMQGTAQGGNCSPLRCQRNGASAAVALAVMWGSQRNAALHRDAGGCL